MLVLTLEREGIAVDITANAQDFVRGIGQAIIGLGGFRVASVAAAGAALAVFSAQSLTQFAGFETTIERGRQKMGLAESATSMLEERIEALQRTTAGSIFSNVQLGSAFAAVAQGGRDVDETFQVLAASTAFVHTRGGDLTQTGKTLSSVLDATGRSGTDAVRVMAALRAAADYSGASLDDLAGIVIENDKAAKNLGISFEDLVATSAFLLNQEKDPRLMFAAFNDLDDPNSDRAQRLWDVMGVKAHDASGRLKPFNDLVQEINISLKANGRTVEEDGRMLQAVFGDKAGAVFDLFRLGALGMLDVKGRIAEGVDKMAQDVSESADDIETRMDTQKARWADMQTWYGENAIAPIFKASLDLIDPEQFRSPWKDGVAPSWSESILTLKGTLIGDIIAGIGDIGIAIWDSIVGAVQWVGRQGERLMSFFGDAKNWLSALPGRIADGLGDLGARVWGAISAGLNWVQTQFDNWRASHPWFDRFVGTIGNIASNVGGALSGDVLTRTTAAPAASSSSSTSISIQTLSLPNVKDVQSFRAELSALSRQNEFTANYQTLSSKRSATL